MLPFSSDGYDTRISLDSNDNVFVADNVSKKIYKLNSDLHQIYVSSNSYEDGLLSYFCFADKNGHCILGKRAAGVGMPLFLFELDAELNLLNKISVENTDNEYLRAICNDDSNNIFIAKNINKNSAILKYANSNIKFDSYLDFVKYVINKIQ